MHPRPSSVAWLVGGIALACGNGGTPFGPDALPTGLPAPAAAAIPLTLIQSAPTSFSEFVPCANGGAGETIEWSGELTLVFHSTTLLTRDGDLRRLLATFHVTGELTGIGQTTGDLYHARTGQHGPVHERELHDRAATATNFVLHLQVRRADGALLGTQRIRAHTTIDPTGAVVVERFESAFSCKGR